MDYSLYIINQIYGLIEILNLDMNSYPLNQAFTWKKFHDTQYTAYTMKF